MGKYDALTNEELIRQMEVRNRRETTRYGKVLALHREIGVEWRMVRRDAKSQRPSLGDTLRLADLAGWGL